MESQEIVNKVANSGILTFNLEELYPREQVVSWDMKQALFLGLVLKEKDFRDYVSQHDWQQYQGKMVLLHCSEDAIVPYWAYMIVAAKLQEVQAQVFFGTEQEFLVCHYETALAKYDFSPYQDKNVVIKGCGEKQVPLQAYVRAAHFLSKYAKKLFYGEPCSTVPIHRRK